jgi:hypothetical protein
MTRYLEFNDDEFASLDPRVQEALLGHERAQTARQLQERGHQERSSFSCRRLKTDDEFQKEVAANISRSGLVKAPDLLHRDANVPWRIKE